jgi:fibronectin type 3 domain-containing protein
MRYNPLRFTKTSRQARQQPIRRSSLTVEALEDRVVPSVSVLQYHMDNSSSGVNNQETILTPSNVNSSSFGKLFSTSVDGQVYAEPLYLSGANITTGPSPGTHNIVFVATEHDSLYAIDADTGVIQWKDSFTDTTKFPSLPGTTSMTPVSSNDVGSGDLTPEISITATPIIDAAHGVIFLEAKDTEVVNNVKHYVHRLYVVNIADGSLAASAKISDTAFTGNLSGYVSDGTYSYSTDTVWTNGTGDGSIGGKIYFNGLRQMVRPGLFFDGGNVYMASASHGDNGPYHGWVIGYHYDTTAHTLSLVAGFNTSPDGGLAGIWQSGVAPVVDSFGDIFFETGNGTFNANTGGHSYGDTFLKLGIDTTTSEGNQGSNANGFGLKVLDYFTPFNQASLNGGDTDLGSGGITLLPDGIGPAGHPNLLVGAGKEGRIYLIDRGTNTQNGTMGGYQLGSGGTDNVVQEIPGGITGSFDSPAFFNNTLYYVGGSNTGGPSDPARAFAFNPNASGGNFLSQTSTSSDTFAWPGVSPTISANGTSNGIVWTLDRGTNQMRAYTASSFATELFNTSQTGPGGLNNSLGSVVKFTLPTVVNGHVYVGTSNALVVYGELNTSSPPGQPPSLTANPGDGKVFLSWGTASGASTYNVYRGTTMGGESTTAIATLISTTSFTDSTVTNGTTYFYIVKGVNTNGTGPASPEASATPQAGIGGGAINFPGGFAGATGLTLNGSAVINGSNLQLTDGVTGNQAGSVWFNTPLDITSFTTQFTFQIPSGTSPTADGFTFAIQNNNVNALGPSGGGLGYGPDTAGNPGGIPNSLAIKFDLYSNAGEGVDSTGLYTGGAAPTTAGSVDMTGSGIDLHTTDVFQVNITYDGSNIQETIKDLNTSATFTHTYTGVNIASTIGNSVGFIGFTGGTGGLLALQDIQTWTLSSGSKPAAPSGLTATGVQGPLVTLSWNDNSNNESGFHIDRATSSDFTQNLQTFTAPANSTSMATFTDNNSVLPGTTYWYRVRATNSAGDSASSNVVSIAIPTAPATPSNGHATLITATEVDLAWTDNATNEVTYRIFRKNGTGGVFNQIATLPPNTTSYKDTGLSPGTLYDYHIEAWNISGNNDRTGATVYTVSPAITTLSAAAGNAQVALSWTAPVGGPSLTYNVYRGTAAGAESTTPIATGVTTTSFTDTSVANGTQYFYEVTSVDPQSLATPSVAPFGESALSNEVSATPTAASFAAHINFTGNFQSGTTPTTPDTVAGYINDIGKAFGSNGGGLTFGWNVDNTANGRDRQAANSPNELQDSLVHMNLNGTFTWSINVPNGTYSVHVTTGDPVNTDVVSKLLVNGVLTVNGSTSAGNNWLQGTSTITVTNGQIMVSEQAGAYDKIDEIDIVQQGSTATAPSITTQPASQTVTAGQSVTFSVVASGTAPLGYQWQKNGTAISGATASSYTISPAQASDAGNYSVVVSNSAGSATSSTATLTVNAATGFAAHIQFNADPTDATDQVAGYVIDSGAAYGARANGMTYGWMANGAPTDNSAQARDRDAGNSPDQLHDGLIHLQKPANPNASWQIAVPNGTYQVHILTGDPTAFDSIYVLNVNGVTAINATPSASNLWFDGTVTITVTNGLIQVTSGTGSSNNKIDAIDIVQQSAAPAINFASGFPNTAGLTLNGTAKNVNNALQLSDTTTTNEAGSAFSSSAVGVGKFTTTFSFQSDANPSSADGFTFVIQNVGATALGPSGGGLGYGPDAPGGAAGIGSSIAVKFDLFNNAGEGVDSTGLFTNGQSPTTGGIAPSSGSLDFTGTLDLHSGHVFTTTISYDGTTLTVKTTDTTTNASATQTYLVNIPGIVGSSSAFVGFTGGTGGQLANQNILSWTFTPQ